MMLIDGPVPCCSTYRYPVVFRFVPVRTIHDRKLVALFLDRKTLVSVAVLPEVAGFFSRNQWHSYVNRSDYVLRNSNGWPHVGLEYVQHSESGSKSSRKIFLVYQPIF